MWKARRVLALGAHTDDIELGCGGTLSRLQREGAVIATAAFSRAELSRPAGTPEDVLEREYRQAMSELGLPSDHVHCFHYPVRTMGQHRQQILDDLIILRRQFNPDTIITMSAFDTHQDHEVINSESVRAFRNRTLLAYQTPWNQRATNAPLFVELQRRDVDVKIDLLRAYRTQAELSRQYMLRDNVEATVRHYGLQAGLEFAEAFEVLSFVARELS